MKLFASVSLVTLAVTLAGCGSSDKNAAPEFSQSSYNFNLQEDTTFAGQLTATDPDNDSLSYAVLTTASQGVFVLNAANGSFSYTPAANYFGTDTVTVQATDNQLSSSVSLTFTIENVNDAPVYQSHSLQSGAAGSIHGQISASDADGDSLSYNLAAQPELGEVVLAQDGSFVYTPYQLELIDDNFSLQLSDGQLTTEVSISLQSQYSTNLDKASYYYASEQSHLKKAQAIADSLNDSSKTDTGYNAIAQGYYQAGFTDRALSLINDNIAQLTEQAAALDKLADYEAARNASLALSYYQQAYQRYNQAMAEKGFASVTADDVSFYTGLSKAVYQLGDAEFAAQVSQQLIIMADSISAEQYSLAYGKLLTGYSTYASNLVDAWLAERTEQNYQLAMAAIANLAYLAENTGYQLSGGLQVTSVKVLRLAAVANLYFTLGDLDNAKRYAARAFAQYNYFDGETPTYRSLDPAYDVAPSAYAKNTLQRYPAGMSSLMAIVAATFGEKYQLVQQLLEQYGSASSLASGTEGAQMYLAYQRIKDGAEVAAVLADLEAYFADDVMAYHQVLIDYTDKNLAAILHTQGYTTQGQAVAEAGLQVFGSAAYQQQVMSVSRPALYTLANRGCIGMADSLDKFAASRGNLAEVCAAHLALFAPEQGKASTVNTLDAYRMTLLTAEKLGAEFSQETINQIIVPQLVSQSALVADARTRLYQTAYSAAALAHAGALTEAQQLVARVLSELRQYIQSTGYSKLSELQSAVGYLTGYLLHDYSGSYTGYDFAPVQQGIRQHAATRDLAAALSAFNSLLSTELVALDQVLSALTLNEQQGIAQDRLIINMAGGKAELAQAQLDSADLAAADKLELQATLLNFYAMLNQFPATAVASVDTDDDGKPNFFAPDATAEQIAAAGLTADDDADNDGVADSDDKAPLDASKH